MVKMYNMAEMIAALIAAGMPVDMVEAMKPVEIAELFLKVK